MVSSREGSSVNLVTTKPIRPASASAVTYSSVKRTEGHRFSRENREEMGSPSVGFRLMGKRIAFYTEPVSNRTAAMPLPAKTPSSVARRVILHEVGFHADGSRYKSRGKGPVERCPVCTRLAPCQRKEYETPEYVCVRKSNEIEIDE